MKKMIIFLAAAVLWLSCTKYNDYKKYIPEGEDTYPGKPDSLKVFPGHDRVLVYFLLQSDPSIVGAKVYWNNKTDSLSLPIKRSSGVDTIRAYVDSLSEGTYNFQVQTFDAAGNLSVPAYFTCNAYGDNYAASLLNVPVQSVAPIPPDQGIIVFGPLDPESGLVGVELKYTDMDGVARDLVAGLTQAQPFVMLAAVGDGTAVSYSGLYLPEATAIDTFSVAASSITIP